MTKRKWKQVQVMQGWIGKDAEKKNYGLYMWNSEMRRLKGKQTDWYEREWPPKRVRITVEVED